MISKKMQDKINEQINKEYYSSYLYLSMSSYCKSISLDGFAAWMRVQSAEELKHAMKLIGYLEDQGAAVKLGAINQPPAEFESVAEAFNKAYVHEKMITKSINELCELSDGEKDYATKSMLTWFVNEQVEEEASAKLMADHLAMIGDSKSSLLYMDKEAGKRAKEE